MVRIRYIVLLIIYLFINVKTHFRMVRIANTNNKSGDFIHTLRMANSTKH